MKFVQLTLLIVLAASSVAAQSLEQALSRQLLDRYQIDSAFARVTLVHSDISAADLTGREVRMIPLTQSEPRGRFPVRVEIFRDGALIEKGSASLEVRRLADLLVPVRQIQRNEPVSTDLFVTKRCDVTALVEPVLKDPAELSGRRARQNLTAGQIVPLHKIERTPMVENGHAVNIVGTCGLLEVRMRGTALQNGSTGETIQVRNIDSKKILSARVTGPGTVEIAL